MKKGIVLGVMVVAIAGLIFWARSTEVKVSKILKIGDVVLNATVADTDAKRIQGLSGREKLAENEGMLFIFDKEGYYPFWMKDMNFPIDMAWIDKDKKITYIEKNATPESYPKFFYATKDGVPIKNLYVLETPAHFFDNNKIEIGATVEF